jgi:hypothetical protein
MKIAVTGIIADIYKGEKGKQYYTVTDMVGGELKFSLEGELVGVKPGDQVQIDAEFVGRPDKSGGVYLGYRQGLVRKIRLVVASMNEEPQPQDEKTEG